MTEQLSKDVYHDIEDAIEVWRDIPNYEGLYQVSDLGNVKSLSVKKKFGRHEQLRSEKILKPKTEKRGYMQVVLCNKKRSYYGIHQLVALAFIPNPDNKPTVNHKDGNKSNNTKSNLEWATHKEQINHADNIGLRNIKGERCKHSKLNNSQVLQIRALKGVMTVPQIANQFEVYISTVRKIQSRKTWQHI